MNSGTGTAVRRALAAAGLFISAILLMAAVLRPAHAADYPRRVAIAPFAAQSEEDISRIVGVLPRLLSSRLAALAGAEVVLLPPDTGSPEAAAREAGVPLLLRGAVVRIGTAYSIDVTALDLGTGKAAGAFFASSDTVDGIIPGLGDLASEMAEKLFGVASAAKAPPAPAPRAAAPPPAPVSATVPAAASPAEPAPVPAVPAPPVPAGEARVPTSIKKVSESGKIFDELYGVAAIDTDASGNGEVVAYGKQTVYIYRISGTDILPYTRIVKGTNHHILNVATIDLDGDGRSEILVTDLVGDLYQSFVLKRKGDIYEEVASGIPYFLTVLSDWQGKRVVAGQRGGFNAPFQGKIVTLTWNGKILKEDGLLPAYVDGGVLAAVGVSGLSSARFGSEWRLIALDESEHLRVFDGDGRSDYKSKAKYGAALDYFEWGPMRPLEGNRAQLFLRPPARVLPSADGSPVILTTQAERGIAGRLTGSFDESRLVVLRWDGSDFVEAAAGPKSSHFLSGADLLGSSGAARRKVVASAIERAGTALKDSVSRLALFELD